MSVDGAVRVVVIVVEDVVVPVIWSDVSNCCANCCMVTGLDKNALIPASWHAFRSSPVTLAVTINMHAYITITQSHDHAHDTDTCLKHRLNAYACATYRAMLYVCVGLHAIMGICDVSVPSERMIRVASRPSMIGTDETCHHNQTTMTSIDLILSHCVRLIIQDIST